MGGGETPFLAGSENNATTRMFHLLKPGEWAIEHSSTVRHSGRFPTKCPSLPQVCNCRDCLNGVVKDDPSGILFDGLRQVDHRDPGKEQSSSVN